MLRNLSPKCKDLLFQKEKKTVGYFQPNGYRISRLRDKRHYTKVLKIHSQACCDFTGFTLSAFLFYMSTCPCGGRDY